MQQLELAQGTPQRISAQGPAMYLANAPLLEYWRVNTSTAQNAFMGGYVLVGFDHSPSLASFDAIIPPFSQLTAAIPDGVKSVFVLFPTDANAKVTSGLPAGTTLPLYVDWPACPVESGLRPLPAAFPLLQPPINAGMSFAVDQFGSIYPPQVQTPVLNQQGNGSLRPHLSPYVADPVHVAATGINTVFVFNGPNLATTYGTTPGGLGRIGGVLRAYVTLSVATLLVIGTASLAVGSQDSREVWRGAVPANQAFLIDFGPEGMMWNPSGDVAGTWKAYTAVSAVLDAIIIGV